MPQSWEESMAAALGRPVHGSLDAGPMGDDAPPRAIAEFLERLPADAPIRAIVNGPGVRQRIREFKRADRDALAHQHSYRNTYVFRLWMTTIGTVIGALLLLLLDLRLLDPWTSGKLRVFLISSQTLAVAMILVALFMVFRKKTVDNWFRRRADAERLRGNIFETIVDAVSTSEARADLTRQTLELVEQAYAKDQLKYLQEAASRHQKALRRRRWPRLCAYFVLLAASAMGFAAFAQELGLPWAPFDTWLKRFWGENAAAAGARWQIGLVAIASSILAHTTARSMMYHDQGKVWLYSLAAEKLQGYINDWLPDAQSKAAAGDLGAVRSFLKGVRDILEAEHAAWFAVRPVEVPADGGPGCLPGARP
jgi:hypothetical protein